MMETPVTWTQLVITSIFILVTTLAPQLYQIYNRRIEAQEKRRKEVSDAKVAEQEAEIKADDKVWERVTREYERALDRAARLEAELEQLRPLALANAVLEQKCKSAHEDKEDWKEHSIALEEQLVEHNIIPRPFRRIPREDDSQKIKTVSRKMKAIKDSTVPPNQETIGGTPTLILPKPKNGG